MKKYDVVIVGGGMVGMALGIILADKNIRVCIVEREGLSDLASIKKDTRVSAIALGSKSMLEHAGVWDVMGQEAEPIFDIRVTDGHSPMFLHYNHHEVSEAPFGWIVENHYTRNALLQVAGAKPNIDILEKTTVKNFEINEDAANIFLNKGEQLTASLLVASDGKKSSLRSEIGIQIFEKNYNQSAIVCTIAHSLPHNGLAQERFLKQGPFAVLPMSQNRSSLVWVEPKNRAAVFLKLTKPAIEEEITKRIGDYLGEVSLIDTPALYPLSLSFVNEYVRPRFALIGDAAHGIHPIAGQGVNLGFRDVLALSDVLIKQFNSGGDLGSLHSLKNYESARRADNLLMIAATDSINALFSNNILPLKLARGMGLLAVGKMPSVKRYFMKRAMGV